MSANARLQIIIDAKDQSKGAFSSVENALKGLGTQGKAAGSALGSMATQIAAAGVLVGGALTTGVGKAVSVFADFEQGMSAVKAASGATNAEMAQLSATALQLGQSTQLAGIDATDAATAMTALAKGGVEVAQMAGAANGALLLASAGEISVGEAADTAVKAMTIFNLTGNEVGHVADVISAGANKSATDVAQLNSAFNQSAAVAKDAGLSLEELTGTLALLAQSGLQGSDAGTALRTTLQRMTGPTEVAKNLMEELGINIFDASGKMRPFPDIVDNLKSAFAGLTDEQRGAALQTIAGADAVRVFLPLIRQGGGAVREWTAAVNDQGFAARTGAALNDNLAGSIDQLGANFQTAAIQIGGKFAPVVRQAADELAEFVTSLSENKEVAAFFDDLAKNASTALTAIIAKLKDPAFQTSLKEWGQAALDVGRTIVSLAGDVASTLGPPLREAVGWFSDLDEQGKKNVIGFFAVAGAAVKFRDELGTLKTVVNDVIKVFGEKAVAKAALKKANEGLATSATGTATAMNAVRAAAAAAGPEIAVAAGVTVVATAAVGGLILAADKYNDVTGTTARNERELVGTRAALAIALANGANETNNAAEGYLRLVAASGDLEAGTGRLSVLWNQYVAGLQMSGQSTDSLGLSMIQLGQFITTGFTSPLGEGLIAGQAFNNTISGLTSAATALGNSLPEVGNGVGRAASAFGVGVSAVQDYNRALSELEANGVVTTRALNSTVNAALAYQQAIAAAQAPTTSTAAALSDLNTYGNAAQQALNNAANAALGAALAFDQTNASLARLGQESGQLNGYLTTLQAEWDALDAAVQKQGFTTDQQSARYAELAPLIQYLNATLGANRENTVAATEAAVAQHQALQVANGSYTAAQAAAAALNSVIGQNTQATGQSTAATSLYASTLAGQAAGQRIASTVATSHTGTINDTEAAMRVAEIAAKAYTSALIKIPNEVTTQVQTPGVIEGTGNVNTLHTAIDNVPRSFTVTANVDISGALAAIATLNANMPHSPADEGPFRTLPNWNALFTSFEPAVNRAIALIGTLGSAVDEGLAAASKRAAETVSAVASAMKGMVDASASVGSIDVAKAPTDGQITGLVSFAQRLVAEVQAASALVGTEGVESSAKWAESANKIASFFSAGSEAFAKVGTYVAIPEQAIHDLAATFRVAVDDLAWVAEQVTVESATLAGQFSEGASKAVDLLSKGVGAFADVLGFAKPENFKGIYYLNQAIGAALDDLALLAERLTVESATLAGKFAEGAGKVVDAIAKGGDAFEGLDTFRFTEPLRLGILHLNKAIMTAAADFAAIVDLIGKEAAGKAELLASAAVKVVETIAKAPAAFEKLTDFRAPTEAALGAFLRTIRLVVVGVADAAKGMSDEVLKLAGEFADAGSKAASLLGAGVSGIKDLATFVQPSRVSVDALLATIQYAISRFGQMATTMSKEGTEATKLFGEATTAVLSGVKLAIDTFIALDKAVVPRTGDLSDLVLAVQGVTRNMATAAAALGDDAIADATAFGSAAQGIFNALKSGLDLFIEIDKPGNWPQTDWLQPLIELMRGVLARGGQLLTQSQELRAIADQFAANLMQAGATFGSAIGLADWSLSTPGLGDGSGLIGGGSVVNNYYTVTGNTLLSKDTATQSAVAAIVTTTQGRTLGYRIDG